MALSLKVYIVSTGQMKTMRFMQDLSVSEVAAEIRDKHSVGGPDHGIFQPEQKGVSIGRWLQADRTLQYYDLQSNTEIHYKKKHRPLKVRLLDNTIKTILVDESLSIQEIAEEIATKMSIGFPEEFSLKVEGSGDREWLTPTLSLHENHVNEDMVLILKKKFFFNDANVDRSDPVQLHLLYVQNRDAVVSGTHPTQRDEAIQLAAIQCQVDYGTFDPEKHKVTTLKLKEILPPQWHKDKKIASHILKEYRKLASMQGENAKYRYIQLCRSLKTYGITTFLVHQKVDLGPKKKPKFIALIIGITRESIVIMDPETKDIKRTFPINHLRRWAPGVRTFTLDFGEWDDDYLTVNTLEGEAISQLIAGYIDIILKRTKLAPRIAEDNDVKTAEEVSVAPIRAVGTEWTTAPVVVDGFNPGGVNESLINPGLRMPGIAAQNSQGFQVSDPGFYPQQMQAPQQPYTIDDALGNMSEFIKQLQYPSEAALVPDDFNPQYCREEFIIQSRGCLSKAAQFVQSLTSGGIDVDGLAKDLAFDISAMIQNARNLANSADQDISLIPGALAVSEAINKILQCAKNLQEAPDDRNAQMAMKIAQSSLKAAQMFLQASQRGVLVPTDHKELVLTSAKALANAYGNLVAQSMQYSNGNPKLSAVANYTGALGDGLLYSARTLAPTMSDPECFKQIATLGSTLGKSCNGLLLAFREAGIDPTQLQRLNISAKNVNDAIAQLINAARGIPGDDPVECLYSATIDISKFGPVLLAPNSGPREIIDSYKQVAKASQQIVQSSKAIVESNPALQGKLLGAMKNLATVTHSLFASATAVAKAPGDKQARTQLTQGARGLLGTVGNIKAQLAKELAFAALRKQAVLVASAGINLATTSERVEVSDDKLRQQLRQSAFQTKPALVKLVASIAEIAQNPTDKESQGILLQAAKNASHPTSQLIAVGKQSVRKVDDGEQRKDLTDACNHVTNALQQLMEAVNGVEEIGGGKEIKDGLEEFDNLAADLESQLIAIDGGFLQPLPGENRNQAMDVLALSVKNLQRALDDLTKAASKEPEKVGEYAANATSQVSQVVQAAKSVASLTRGKDSQKNIVSAAVDITKNAGDLFNKTREAVMDPDNLELVQPMNIAKRDTDQSCVNLMNAARGINTIEITSALDFINAAAQKFTIGRATGFSQSVGVLKKAVAQYSSTASQVVAAAMTNPKGLGNASKLASQVTAALIGAINNSAALFSDKDSANAVLDSGKSAVEAMVALISQAMSAAAQDNPNSAELRKANLNLSHALRDLINAVKPGQADITEALNIISNAMNNLDSDDPLVMGTTPLWDLHQSIKQLASLSGGIMVEARSQQPTLGSTSKEAASTINDLVNASRAVSNPQENPCSVVASKLINISAMIERNPADIAKVIANTKAIANLTKEAISAAKEIRGDPTYRAEIIKSSQGLGVATANLGKATKSLATKEPGAPDQVKLASGAIRVQAQKFRDATISTDKAPVPTEVMDALFNSTRSVSTAISQLISAASTVSDDPNDYNADSDMSSAVKILGDSISSLQSVTSNLAPGAAESASAMKALQGLVGELDRVGISIAAGVDLSDKKPNASIQQLHTALSNVLRDLATETQHLVKNTIDNPDQVAATFNAIQKVSTTIGKTSLDVIYSTNDKQASTAQVNKAKDLLKSCLQLIQSAKNASVNPGDNELVNQLTASSQKVKDSITALGGELQGGMLALQECDEALQALQRSLHTLNTPAQRDNNTTYQDCQKDIKGKTRSLANGLSNLVTTANKNPDQIGVAAKELSELVAQLVEGTRVAAVVTRQPEVQKALLTNVMNVAKGAAGMIQNAKKVAENTKDRQASDNLSRGLSSVTDGVSNLLNAVKLGATAERDIENAVDVITKVKVDLDSAALFAASGQFSAEVQEGRNLETSVNDLKTNIKNLAGNANHLSDSSKGFQEQFAQAAKITSDIITKIAGLAKETASLLPDLMSQQSILTGARAVTIAAQQAVLAGKDAQANPLDNGAQKALESALEGISLAGEQLSSISESASADLIITIHELQKAIRSIRQALKQYGEDSYQGEANATPSTIFESAKGVVKGNGQLLSTYGSSQDDFIKSLREIDIQCVAMINRTKGARKLTNNDAIHTQIDTSIKSVVQSLVNYFEAGKLQRIDDPQYYKKFSDHSEAVTGKLNDFVTAIKTLPGGKDLSWEDSDDNVAETELQNAIAAIEAAKNRLLDISTWKPVAGGLDLGEIAAQIVEATKGVAVATQQLVITATDVQNEIVSQGRATSKKLGQVYKKDPAWEEGLISAAKAVAGTTEDLVNFANQSVKGECGEEMLIACVRGVGGATARLVSAAKAKADPFSTSHQSLGSCAKKVAEATQGLAEATKAATERKIEQQMKKKVGAQASFAGLRAKELEEQARIAKLELELERARQNLFQKRKKEYQN